MGHGETNKGSYMKKQDYIDSALRQFWSCDSEPFCGLYAYQLRGELSNELDGDDLPPLKEFTDSFIKNQRDKLNALTKGEL